MEPLGASLGHARVYTEADRLVADTGCVRRVWRWTGSGFATQETVASTSGNVWDGRTLSCDWQLPDGRDAGPASLQGLSASVQDDEGFTSQHICVAAEIDYPDAGLRVRWTVWVYPDAPGVRTQLAARLSSRANSPSAPALQGGPPAARVDCIPLGDAPGRRRLLGYYNDTQNRNDTHQDILKEAVIDHPLMDHEWCDWASAACLERETGGIALVKESHKCVNQRGCGTGGFVCSDSEGLACTGWGLRAEDICQERYVPAWATWCLAWGDEELGRERAFKQFDRLRFSIDPDRDIYVQANTWGSTASSSDARRAAGEKSVLAELETCAELGIDTLQIDDGWQVPPGHSTWKPGERGWHPHPESYPSGWDVIRKRAEDLGVKLGLWAAAQFITLDELKANYEDGGFLQYKLDFANLRQRPQIEELMSKVRAFVASTGHGVRVNWDVTENEARYGYFFARDYGCIYLENRKPVRPRSVVYRPHTVLRDLWQISKYLNLHRFQCSIQNVDMVDRDCSDAHLHSHSYATAIALMGIPLFFQETKYYSEEAKREIAALLAIYKEHRAAIYQGMVHPVGSCPDNASWTGFQCHLADAHEGYLTLFRERCNLEPQGTVRLAWLSGQSLEMRDLITGESSVQQVAADGCLPFSIDAAPGFLFLHYRW